jgi:hypothetical protein
LLRTDLRLMGLLCALTVLPAALLMGATFPAAARLWAAGTDQLGSRLGGVYGANVAGAILGSLLGGFVLVPVFGAHASLLLLAALNVLLGAWLLRAAGVALVLGGLVAAPIALPVLPTSRMVDLGLAGARDDWAEMLGWPELAATVAAAWDRLPPAQRAGAAVVAATTARRERSTSTGRASDCPRRPAATTATGSGPATAGPAPRWWWSASRSSGWPGSATAPARSPPWTTPGGSTTRSAAGRW